MDEESKGLGLRRHDSTILFSLIIADSTDQMTLKQFLSGRDVRDPQGVDLCAGNDFLEFLHVECKR